MSYGTDFEQFEAITGLSNGSQVEYRRADETEWKRAILEYYKLAAGFNCIRIVDGEFYKTVHTEYQGYNRAFNDCN